MIGSLVLLVPLLCSTAAALQMTGPSTYTARVGSIAHIPCTFTADELPADPRFFAIFWYLEGRMILSYDDTVPSPDPRYSLDKDRAVYGNADLTISNALVSDGGDYTCSVTYSPLRIEKNIRVEISAVRRLSDPVLTPLCLQALLIPRCLQAGARVHRLTLCLSSSTRPKIQTAHVPTPRSFAAARAVSDSRAVVHGENRPAEAFTVEKFHRHSNNSSCEEKERRPRGSTENPGSLTVQGRSLIGKDDDDYQRHGDRLDDLILGVQFETEPVYRTRSLIWKTCYRMIQDSY